MRDNGPGKVSVGRAINIGLLWVNGPVLLFLCSPVVLVVLDRAHVFGEAVSGLLKVISFVVGFIVAWLWWSITVPKWRLWAYERVDDLAELKAQAVASGLTWPDGSVFERTEIKSKEHRERERAREREKTRR